MPTAAAPRGQTTELLLKPETTYGTAATGNYQKTLVYNDGLEEPAPQEPDPILGSPRHNQRDTTTPAPGLKNGVTGNLIVPLDLNHLWFWLRGAFGTPVSSGSSDYVHTFTSGGEVLPHHTIEGKRKSDVLLQRIGCLVAGINGSISRKGGYDRATVPIMGKKETNLASSAGGTPPTILARDPLLAAIPVLKIDTVAVADVLELSWNYSNGATPQDYLGDAEGYPTGHDLDGEATFGGTFRARFRTDALYDQAKAGTPFAMEILWQRTAARLLSLAAPVVRLDPIGLPVSGPGRIEMNFSFRAEQSDSAAMLTAVLKNGSAAAAYA
jgi:hypothetical protein